MRLPSGAAITMSKPALSPSAIFLSPNSGLTPIIGPDGATGNTILRSTARPPASVMRMKIWASCGLVELGGLSRLTGNLAAPAASVSGRSSIGVRSLLAVSSSATPN